MKKLIITILILLILLSFTSCKSTNKVTLEPTKEPLSTTTTEASTTLDISADSKDDGVLAGLAKTFEE